MQFSIGSRVGRYEIVSPIAAGGMGEVYRARDLERPHEVAIKALAPAIAADPDMVARFTLEARAIAALSHPNILELYEFLSDHDPPCVVTELLTGETLAEIIKRGAVDWRSAIDHAIQVAAGLGAAHDRRIIHRDLKPANVFLTRDGRIKILDFGLATVNLNLLEGPSGDDDDTAVLLEDTGPMTGTLPYMSPEQVRGEDTDAGSDIFSLGSLLYELLTGRKAFQRPSVAETVAALLHEEPTPAETFIPEIPPTLASVVRRCLRKARHERFESARDVIATLRVAALDSGSASVALPERTETSIIAKIESIAVLPFEVASDESASEYLGDGVTETLIQSLAELDDLRVMAAATVFRYRSGGIDPLEAGAGLGVDVVVAGRLFLSGNDLRLTAELIDVDDGARLWGERHAGTAGELAEIQDRLAAGLVRALRPRDSRRHPSPRRHTGITDAYKLYLRGRFCWNKRTIDDLRQATHFFQEAIEIDPTYGLAFSGLADCYSILSNYGAYEPRDGYGRARAAAARALELDPSLAEAHSSSGYVEMMGSWNLAGAAKEFRAAIELNANYPTAHHWYSHYFEAIGEHEEALAEIRRAKALDPLSVVIDSIVGFHLFVARRYDEAIDHLTRLLENEPTFPRAHADLAEVLFQVGEREDAARHRVLARRYGSGGREETALLETALAQGGVDAVMTTLLNEMLARPVMPHVEVATMLSRLGRHAEAVDALERALEAHCDTLLFLHRPQFDPLRSDRRFEAVAERVRAEARA